MRKKRPVTREEFHSEVERRWLKTALPPKMATAVSTLIMVVALVALCVAVYLNRARIGAFWQQVTGKAPPLQVMPEKPEHEGPEIEGRDF